MAPIPPFLSQGQVGPAAASCSESSEQLFPFSFSCSSSSGLPALYQCQRKTTAVPSPTILPDHSTPCSDTQTALLLSEPSRCSRQLAAGHLRRNLAQGNPKRAKRGRESWRMPSVQQLSLTSASHACKSRLRR